MTRERKLVNAFIILAAALTILIYGKVVHYDFVHVDDDRYIAHNPYIQHGLTWEGIKWAFTADLTSNSDNADYWQPVTFISRMLDIQFFGLNPAGHHLMNVFFHLANGIILFFILRKLTEKIYLSGFVSLMFLVHPIQAEVVSWVTARKDALSVFFLLLSLWNYVNYSKNHTRKSYFSALCFFVLSLLSKPAGIMFPFILILLDWWPLARTNEKCFLKEKLPFFTASFLLFLIGVFSKTEVHSTFNIKNFSLGIIAYNIFDYLRQLFFPIGLSFYDTISKNNLFSKPEVILGACLLIGISFTVFLKRKKHPYYFTGWFWFLISLVPVIYQTPTNNRFLYFPMIGIFIIAAYFADDLRLKGFVQEKLLFFTAVLILLVSGFSSYWQAGYWKNDKRLIKHALDVNPESYVMHTNLASILTTEGKVDQAIEHCEKALSVNPNYAAAHNSLGILLSRVGSLSEAEAHFKTAILLAPQFIDAYFYYGALLEKEGKKEQAILQYRQALKIVPDFAAVRERLKALQVSK